MTQHDKCKYTNSITQKHKKKHTNTKKYTYTHTNARSIAWGSSSADCTQALPALDNEILSSN